MDEWTDGLSNIMYKSMQTRKRHHPAAVRCAFRMTSGGIAFHKARALPHNQRTERQQHCKQETRKRNTPQGECGWRDNASPHIHHTHARTHTNTQTDAHTQAKRTVTEHALSDITSTCFRLMRSGQASTSRVGSRMYLATPHTQQCFSTPSNKSNPDDVEVKHERVLAHTHCITHECLNEKTHKDSIEGGSSSSAKITSSGGSSCACPARSRNSNLFNRTRSTYRT